MFKIREKDRESVPPFSPEFAIMSLCFMNLSLGEAEYNEQCSELSEF